MNKNSKINLAVLMPVFNEEEYVSEAIHSILNFEYPSNLCVRVIAVDDFSTDRTYDVLCELPGAYGDRLVVKKNSEKGKNNAINEAIDGLDCEYICLMGGDDRMVPSVLTKRVFLLHEELMDRPADFNEIASVCKIRTFSEWPRYHGITIPKEKSKGAISGGSIMMSMGLAKTIFPLPTDLPNEDTWISLHLRYREILILHLGEVGLMYRIHAHNSHQRGGDFGDFNKSMWQRGRAVLLFYIKYSKNMPNELERKLLREVAVECLKSLRASCSIIFMKRLNLRDRIVGVTYSSSIAYYLKQKFYGLLAGR